MVKTGLIEWDYNRIHKHKPGSIIYSEEYTGWQTRWRTTRSCLKSHFHSEISELWNDNDR